MSARRVCDWKCACAWVSVYESASHVVTWDRVKRFSHKFSARAVSAMRMCTGVWMLVCRHGYWCGSVDIGFVCG